MIVIMFKNLIVYDFIFIDVFSYDVCILFVASGGIECLRYTRQRVMIFYNDTWSNKDIYIGAI